MKISNLHITQDSLRNTDQVLGMYEFVKNGGRFNGGSLMKHMIAKNQVTRPKLIGLLRLVGHEDPSHNEKLWLRDGNHRVVSISFIRDNLFDDEYYIEEMPYSMMTETNFDVGWITPFDPLTHVRRAEFSNYRKKVYEIFESSGKILAEQYIREHLADYALPRTFSHSNLRHLSEPIWRSLGVAAR